MSGLMTPRARIGMIISVRVLRFLLTYSSVVQGFGFVKRGELQGVGHRSKSACEDFR
jgi:hypothetical protein